MDIQYHINLNNEYEFKYYCTQESIKAFEATINSKTCPSRITIFINLLQDLATAPFYLAEKLVDLAIHIFRLMNVKTEDQQNMDWTARDLAGIIIFQLFNPAACTAIRISAAVAGLLMPCLALKGWKLAEHGESLSYLLWINIFKDIDYESIEKQAHEEIIPAHAIYYLGKTQTRIALGKDSIDYQELENEITTVFEKLLRTIASNDRDCFHTLLDYSKATDSQVTMGKNGTSYRISYDVKEILKYLKSSFQKDGLIIEDFIDLLKEELSIEEYQRLFIHIYINLRNSFLEDELNIDKSTVDGYLTDLKDLFSQRFRFGRAHFPQSFYNPYCSGSD